MLLSTLIFTLLSPALYAQNVALSLTSEQLFAKASGTVFPLRTREIGVQSESEHGTAFSILESGYLLTNFHVVAKVVEQPLKYELVLEFENKMIKSQVVYIDAVNDLALIKIDQKFKNVLTVAAELVEHPGENIYSFGYPKSEGLTLVQGNLNLNRNMGFAPVMTGTVPINPGMSGGPCLNIKGEVIAVNRAILTAAQSVSYFSPWSAVHHVSQNAERLPKLDANTWRAFLVDEIEAQEKVGVLKSKIDQSPVQHFGSLQFVAPLNASCGQGSLDDKPDSAKVFLCPNVSLAVIGSDLDALSMMTFVTQSKTTEKSMNPIKLHFEKIKKQYEQKLLKQKNKKLIETCNSKNIVNRNQVRLVVRYCSVAIPEYKGLYSTILRIDHPKKGLTETIGQSYDGLTMPTTTQVMSTFIDSIAEDLKP